MTKVQRWEKNFFSALVDENGIGFNERIVEINMAYYYQNMDTDDLVMAGSMSDIDDGYLLLSDLGLRALLSLYCAKGKDFDQYVFKNEMKELGFNVIVLRIKVLVSWRYGVLPYLMIFRMMR